MASIARSAAVDNPAKRHLLSDENISFLVEHGAHLVLLKGDRIFQSERLDNKGPKFPVMKKWQETLVDAEKAKHHVAHGGLLGLVPKSLKLIVIDVDLPESLKVKNATKPVTLATKKADLFCRITELVPAARVTTSSGGIHMYFPCPDNLPDDLVRPRGWAFRRADGKTPSEPDGDIRYRGSQVVLWNGARELCRHLRNPRVGLPAMTEGILAYFEFKFQHHQVSRDRGYKQPFFANKKVELFYPEEEWVREIDTITPISRGIHDFFGTIIHSLIYHRAHSYKVLERVQVKYRECLALAKNDNSRVLRPEDNTELRRWYEKAIGNARWNYRRDLKDTFRPITQDKPSFIEGDEAPRTLDDVIDILLTPKFGDGSDRSRIE